MGKVYFEDCRVGDRAASPGRTVTETDIVMFSALTEDWNPLHTNAEDAKATAFGDRIAHGLLVQAISVGLLFRGGTPSLLPKSLIALVGMERIRFVAPTRIHDTIRVESEVVKLTEVDAQRGLMTLSNRVINQLGDEVLTYTSKILTGRRSAGGNPTPDRAPAGTGPR